MTDSDGKLNSRLHPTIASGAACAPATFAVSSAVSQHSIDMIRICKSDSSIKRCRLFLPVGKESTAMQTNPHFNQLGQAVSKFKTCIQDLPKSKFLQPINGWAPRDVLTHLIGWN